MNPNNSDRDAKTNSFGIGELGQTPEYDPAAILTQPQPSPAPAATGQWELAWYDGVAGPDLNSDRVLRFNTLDDVLAAARQLPDGHGAYIGGPGHTVGYHTRETGNHPAQLQWRRLIPLDEPVYHCEECGGSVKNGRCTQCGERDMIAVSWERYENHTEVKTAAGRWVELDARPIGWARDDGQWYYQAIVSGRLSEWTPLS